MRRCEDGRKVVRSGEVSTRLVTCGTKAALSRAFSAIAAWAVWMAVEVPVRETPGDCGFRGSGGGARSGSELSHLFFISVRQRSDMTWSSRLARVDVRLERGSRASLTWEPARGHGRLMRHAGVLVACGGHEGHPSLWRALWWLCRVLEGGMCDDRWNAMCDAGLFRLRRRRGVSSKGSVASPRVADSKARKKKKHRFVVQVKAEATGSRRG
jgi:hypothetical protein